MQVLFLDPLKQSPASKRQYELQIATARSHAARVTHRLKKSPKPSRRLSIHSETDSSVDEQYLGPVYPGFGSFRSEITNLLPSHACRADLQALDFFIEVILPGIDVANEMFNNTGAFHFVLPNLTIPVSYHATMAKVHLTVALHRVQKAKASPLMLEHRGKAINELRSLLDSGEFGVSEPLISAIISMATVEGALGNTASYQMHLAGLKVLERQKGSVKVSQEHTASDIIALYSDTLNVLKTGKSLFERRPYESTHLIRTLPQLVPEGFTILSQERAISDNTISVIINACRLGLTTPCVTLTSVQRLHLANRRGSVRRYNNYLDSVPIFFVPDNLTTSPGVFFEKMLVLALSLYAWCGFTTIRLPHFAMYNAMMTQLTDRLFLYSPESVIKRQCAAWMWVMIVDAWRVGEGSNETVSPQGLDILWEFHERFPEYRSWAQVERLTRMFLWTGNMETFWSKRWDGLSAREFE